MMFSCFIPLRNVMVTRTAEICDSSWKIAFGSIISTSRFEIGIGAFFNNKTNECSSVSFLGVRKLFSYAYFKHQYGSHVHCVSNDLFGEMPPDYRACNTRIRICLSEHDYHQALSVFKQMQIAGLKPDGLALAAVIKSSAVVSSNILGKAIHGFAFKCCYDSNATVGKALIDMYNRFGSLDDACRTFKDLTIKDSVSWNVLLTGYVRAELDEEAVQLFNSMRACGVEEVKATPVTFAVIIPVCAKLRSLGLGTTIHALAMKLGLESDTLVGNVLISMYAKCTGAMKDAYRVFSDILCKDVISWNSIISGHSENSQFYEAVNFVRQMVVTGVMPNYATVATVLPICALVEDGCSYGKELHCHVLRFDLERDLSVSNALLTYYSKVRDLERAEFVFKKMLLRDLVTWNTMIAGYGLNGFFSRALDLYYEMLLSWIKPDSVTLISLLPIYAELYCLADGKKIHGVLVKCPNLWQRTSLNNALISFYGKCGESEDALQVFNEIFNKDLITWNALLSVYVEKEQLEKFCFLLMQMNLHGVQPDYITILSVLQASAFYGKRMIRQAHGYSFRTGFISLMAVGNAILDAYAKCGRVEEAFKTFRSLTEKNIITGNSMISGYLRHGNQEDAETIFSHMFERDLTTWNLMIQVYALSDCSKHAFGLFQQFQLQGIRPDSLSILSILPACVRLASVHLVRQCHSYVLRASFQDIHLVGALLDAYSKCGSISNARKLFFASKRKDLIMFTAMIGGYAMHGMAEEATSAFSQMLELGIKPDHVLLTALLSACSHAGQVNEGLKLFKSITEVHGVNPTMEHYACIVDLLARKGRIKEAYYFILDMPLEANPNIWGALLGACKIHKEVEIGKVAAHHLLDTGTEDLGNFVVLSNIYAADGRWHSVEKVRRLIKDSDLKKPAGCSWIEIESSRHAFVAGDFLHPQRTFLYHMLKTLDRQMKEPHVELS